MLCYMLQHLRPAHFASADEYRDFAERQLALFAGGTLAAVHAAPRDFGWQAR